MDSTHPENVVSFPNRGAKSFRFHPRILSVVALFGACAFAQAQDRPGWTLNWADEFSAATINTTRWEKLNRRDSYNNEQQYYTPNQLSIVNNALRITATNQPLDGKPYRSGLVRTWAEQTYGRWEIRASLPTTQGMWPAIWLLPRNTEWPDGGEIDIMENRGSQPTLVGSAYHFGTNNDNHQWIADEFTNTVNGDAVTFHGSMHTYAVEWDNQRVLYFVDGVPHFSFYRNAAPISSTPMSLILNLAVGGDYGGNPNGTTVFPQHFDIDYVRVYNRNAATSALLNTSFESKAGDQFTDWIEYSNGANVKADPVAANAHIGTTAAQVSGRNNNQTNSSGLFQEIPTTAGQVWQVGAFSQNRFGEALTGDNLASIKLEFIDSNGNVIQANTLPVVDANSPEAYREAVVRRTAPANSVFARAVLHLTQVGNAPGSVNFDGATIRRFTGASVAGDINLDGTANSFDLDALNHSLNNVNVMFDYNTDGSTNASDVDKLLLDVFNTHRGDTNLDEAVDFDDLLTVAQNYGKMDTGHWAIGDFDGNSDVDFADLLVVAQFYNVATLTDDPAFTETFAADWARARAMTPEPATLTVFAAAGLLLRRRSGSATRCR